MLAEGKIYADIMSREGWHLKHCVLYQEGVKAINIHKVKERWHSPQNLPSLLRYKFHPSGKVQQTTQGFLKQLGTCM